MNALRPKLLLIFAALSGCTVLEPATTGEGAQSSADLADPNADGPFAVGERDAQASVASTGDRVAVHVVAPTSGGPYPLVVFAHGFQLPPSQYYGYLKRLATFGYVALTVDYPASFSGSDNPRQAKDLLGGIEWAKHDASLSGRVDDTRIGVSGHSLGGKLALLAATIDPQIRAAFVLDPVDGGPNGCQPPACVVVKDKMAELAIPTSFVGETTDSAGSSGQACAPAADNFATFYARTRSPSVQVTALGANHMSFLDQQSSCGFTCSFCNAASAPNAQVNGMSRALMTAFFERYLRGNRDYDTYLVGARAAERYVTTNQAKIESK